MTPRTYLLLWLTMGTVFGTVFLLAARLYLVNPILRALAK